MPASRLPASAPNPPRPPALLQSALDLSARLLTLEAAARRVRRAEDDEAVHNFRVASRRLIAALDLWNPLLDPRAAARTRRRVRGMRRDLSAARDLEVLGARLRERLATAPSDARIVLEARIARIDRKLETYARHAPRVVARRTVQRVRRGLLRAVRRSPAPPDSPRADDLARVRIAATRERALAALGGAWARRDDPSFHEARVRIKAWRYAREIVAEQAPVSIAPGPPADPPAAWGPSVGELRGVQEALGNVQDLAITARDLERQARRARRRGRPALAATIEALVEAVVADKLRATAEAQRRSMTLSVAAVRGRAAGA